MLDVGSTSFTGQSVSESCSGTTSELTHWWIRGSSSATEPESIDILEPRGMRASDWLVSFRNLWGHNQLAISLADF